MRLVELVGMPLTIGGIDDPGVWVKTANNFVSLVAILTVAALYSATGGLRSVVATDMVQIVIISSVRWRSRRSSCGRSAVSAR